MLILFGIFGDYTKPEVIFRTHREEAETRMEAVSLAFDLIVSIVVVLLAVPAVNTWLAVHPVICQLLLGCNFHNLYQCAWSLAVGNVGLPDLIGMSSDDGAAEVGVPNIEQRTFQKTKPKRSDEA